VAERVTLATQSGQWTIRPYQEGDEGQIVDLFNRVFGKNRSLAHWHWQFRDNPEGKQIVVAVTGAGKVVGHYAAIPVRVTVDGRPFIFSQIVDSMVDRDSRRGLKRPGISTSLLTRLTQDHGAHDRAAVMYGFPTPETQRITQRLNGFAYHRALKLVRVVDGDLRRTPWQQMGDLWDRARFGVLRVNRVDASVDRLWERCCGELRVATVRDARYLNWRYADCPDVTYRILVAKGLMTSSVQGLAVLRLGCMDQPIACLVDWLIPTEAEAAADRLLVRSLQEAKSAGMKELQAWLPASSPWHLHLLDCGFRAVEDQGIGIRSFTPAIPVEFLQKHWYYTMGDSDFV